MIGLTFQVAVQKRLLEVFDDRLLKVHHQCLWASWFFLSRLGCYHRVSYFLEKAFVRRAVFVRWYTVDEGHDLFSVHSVNCLQLREQPWCNLEGTISIPDIALIQNLRILWRYKKGKTDLRP